MIFLSRRSWHSRPRRVRSLKLDLGLLNLPLLVISVQKKNIPLSFANSVLIILQLYIIGTIRLHKSFASVARFRRCHSTLNSKTAQVMKKPPKYGKPFQRTFFRFRYCCMIGYTSTCENNLRRKLFLLPHVKTTYVVPIGYTAIFHKLKDDWQRTIFELSCHFNSPQYSFFYLRPSLFARFIHVHSEKNANKTGKT